MTQRLTLSEDRAAVPDDPDPEQLLLVIVGAHLRAEVRDRPLAARLTEAIDRWRSGHADDVDLEPLRPLTCTDLWHANAPDLQTRPAIAIGPPDVNAATALFATRLPTALVIEGSLRIHLDPEHIDLRACLWGAEPEGTAAALEIFMDRYLDPFLRSVHGLGA